MSDQGRGGVLRRLVRIASLSGTTHLTSTPLNTNGRREPAMPRNVLGSQHQPTPNSLLSHVIGGRS